MGRDDHHLLFRELGVASPSSGLDLIKEPAQVQPQVEGAQQLVEATVDELDMVFVGQRDDCNLVDFAFVP
jgi:hypothetical protein